MTTTTSGPRERIGSPTYRLTTIGSVALISLFAFEALAVGTAMPVAAAALDGLSLYALAFGAPLAAGVIGMVTGGPWSDRSGPITEGSEQRAPMGQAVIGGVITSSLLTLVVVPVIYCYLDDLAAWARRRRRRPAQGAEIESIAP